MKLRCTFDPIYLNFYFILEMSPSLRATQQVFSWPGDDDDDDD